MVGGLDVRNDDFPPWGGRENTSQRKLADGRHGKRLAGRGWSCSGQSGHPPFADSCLPWNLMRNPPPLCLLLQGCGTPSVHGRTRCMERAGMDRCWSCSCHLWIGCGHVNILTRLGGTLSRTGVGGLRRTMLVDAPCRTPAGETPQHTQPAPTHPPPRWHPLHNALPSVDGRMRRGDARVHSRTWSVIGQRVRWGR